VITGAISLVIIIAIVCCDENGERCSVAVGVVLVLILLLLGSCSRDEARAHNNFVDYWSDGGPDR
jgi:hypothetical protein